MLLSLFRGKTVSAKPSLVLFLKRANVSVTGREFLGLIAYYAYAAMFHPQPQEVRRHDLEAGGWDFMRRRLMARRMIELVKERHRRRPKWNMQSSAGDLRSGKSNVSFVQ